MRPHPLHIKSVRSKVRPRGAGKPSAEHLLSLYPVPHVEQCYFCSFGVQSWGGGRTLSDVLSSFLVTVTVFHSQ